MLRNFIRLSEVIIAGGSHVSFEWPKSSLGWHQDELLKFITRFNLYSVVVHGCALGMTNNAGEPVLKEWRFVTTSPRLAAALEPLKCKHEKGLVSNMASYQGGQPLSLPFILQNFAMLCYRHYMDTWNVLHR